MVDTSVMKEEADGHNRNHAAVGTRRGLSGGVCGGAFENHLPPRRLDQ